MAATLPALPAVATVVTVLLYLVDDRWQLEATEQLGLGLAVSFAAWLVFAITYWPHTTARAANPRAYRELQSRTTRLAKRLQGLTTSALPTIDGKLAEAEIRAAITHLRKKLRKGRGEEWVKATGYIDLWARLHRAEEALLDLETREGLVEAALQDRGRLQGSRIGEGAGLLQQIEFAISTLAPEAAGYVHPNRKPNGSAHPAPADEAAARAALKTVRRQVNSQRDEYFNSIILTRGRLLNLTLSTVLVVYALLGIAVIAGAPADAILSAAIFFLIGAGAGLFDRLRWSDAAPEVDDYGLDRVRLALIPLVSGIAAVMGVFLAATLSQVSQPIAEPADATATAQSTEVPTLEATFNIDENRGAIIVAAIFGLAPSLVISRLLRGAEASKEAIQKSQGPPVGS